MVTFWIIIFVSVSRPGTYSQSGGRRVVRRRKVNDDKSRVNDNVIIVENFDKSTLSDLLDRKEKKVGEVVLVNGKPAIIKKRKVDKILEVLEPKSILPSKNLQKIRVRRIGQKKKVDQYLLPKRMKITFPKSLKRKVLRKKVVI